MTKAFSLAGRIVAPERSSASSRNQNRSNSERVLAFRRQFVPKPPETVTIPLALDDAELCQDDPREILNSIAQQSLWEEEEQW
jgi:hypothetical protein